MERWRKTWSRDILLFRRRQVEGKWKYDEVHGKGTYVYPGGERFSGEWKDGNKHKHGRLIFPK